MIVTRNIDAALTGIHGEHINTRIQLAYDTDHPYEVHLTFGGVPGVLWVFARVLLAAGLYLEAGPSHGDVHVWPHGDRVRIRLSSDDGSCEVDLGREQVAEFIAATQRLVPFGAERVDVDADGWLAAMTARGGDR